MTFGYFIIGVISATLGRMFYEILKSQLYRQREKKFLKTLTVRFPNNEGITYISVESSDWRSLRELERYLRDEQGIPQGQLDPIFRRIARKKK